MSSYARRLAGLVLMLGMIPVFVGLMACIPVPLGDPESSRIDPDLNGTWIVADEQSVLIYVFEPYDKRTWLVRGVAGFERDDTVEPDASALGYDEMIAIAVAGDGEVEELPFYKVWRKKLGKHWFMTWEPKAEASERGKFAPDAWLGFRLDKFGKDEFRLLMIDVDSDLLDSFNDKYDSDDYELPRDTKVVQRALEREVKQHANDMRLYFGDDEGPAEYRFYRLRTEDRERLAGYL